MLAVNFPGGNNRRTALPRKPKPPRRFSAVSLSGDARRLGQGRSDLLRSERLRHADQYARIKAVTGNVGIGASTPATQLAIGISTAADQFITIDTAGGNMYRAGISFRHFNTTGGLDIVDSELSANDGWACVRYPFWDRGKCSVH